MSRVEKTESVQDRVRDEVVLDIRDKKSKRNFWSNCFFLLLAFVVGCFLWIGWIVASTGLYYIPVLSSLAFHKPEPIRVVASGTPVEVLAESTFKSVLAERLQSGGGKLTDRSIALTIPESSLTATIRNTFQNSSMALIDSSGVQVAVLPNQQFELFIPLKNEMQKTAAIAHISLTANQGVMNLVLKDVSVGSFHAPQFLIASLVQSYVNAQLSSINQALGSYMRVDALTYKQGSVILSGDFTVQLK